MNTLDSTNPEMVASHAGMLAMRGRLAEARALLEDAARRLPPHPVLWHNLAEVLKDSGETGHAETLWRSVIQRWPRFIPAYVSLGRLVRLRHLTQGGQERDLAVILNNHGNACSSAGDQRAAEGCFRDALALVPDYGLCWSNLSNTLRIMGRATEAELCARRALELSPDLSEAWNNLGCALNELSRRVEAHEAFLRALELNPASKGARHNADSGGLFNLLFDPTETPATILAAHREYGEARRPRLATPPPARARTDGRIRVGFLSGDFREHAMAHFIAPVLTHLDRARFDLTCYANQERGDALTAALRALPLTWRDVAHLDDDALAAAVRADNLDVLVDLSGHTDGNRLDALLRRPAPQIATWLGYMSTTGHPAIGWRLTDRHTDPEPQSGEHHTERLAYLRQSQFVYRPEAEAPEVAPLPARTRGYITFGSFNNARKLTLPTIRAWARILQEVPGSRLVLRAKLFADPGTLGYYRGLFTALDVDLDRIEMHPYVHGNQHLACYGDIDIGLDPFPYAGGTTTCDALWMGAPVVSLAGDRSVGRMGVSILTALGMTDWVAPSVDAYVERAVGHARDLEKLTSLRQELRGRFAASPLRDEPGFAADFGRCLEEIVASGTR